MPAARPMAGVEQLDRFAECNAPIKHRMPVKPGCATMRHRNRRLGKVTFVAIEKGIAGESADFALPILIELGLNDAGPRNGTFRKLWRSLRARDRRVEPLRGSIVGERSG
jgi:hypothetical protein